jgi:hypothetical protein
VINEIFSHRINEAEDYNIYIDTYTNTKSTYLISTISISVSAQALQVAHVQPSPHLQKALPEPVVSTLLRHVHSARAAAAMVTA